MLNIGALSGRRPQRAAGFIVAIFDDERELRQLPAAVSAIPYVDAMFHAVVERDGVVLVARMGERRVGFGCIVPSDDLDPSLREGARSRATVDYLFVARPGRRLGVGRRLPAALELAMRERWRSRIRLRVKAANVGARQLYEAAGYLPQELIFPKASEHPGGDGEAMHITLRPATANDLAFARSLYLDNMREVSQRTGFAWDEARQTVNFDGRFLVDEISIVSRQCQDIGWMQIAESESEIFLKQFFVDSAHQRRGIGTQLLQELLKRAAQAGKTVTLGVVKGNPARSLYERHGFQITSEDDYKVYMAISP